MSSPSHPTRGLLPPATLRGNRRFWSLYAADTVSGIGDRIHILALFLLVFQRTGRAFDLGLLAIVQLVPATVIAPFAGWLCDRVERRRLMVAMDLLRFGLVLAISVAADISQVLVLAAALAAARQIHEPARLAVLPALVVKEQVARANAISMATLHLLLMVGPAAGGVLVERFGTALVFQIDAVTYAVSAGLLLWGMGRVPAPGLAQVAGRSRWASFAAQVRDGARYIWVDPVLRYAIVFLALMTLVSSMQQPLVVVFVKDRLGAADSGLGLLLSAAGLGGIVGSVLAASTSRWRSPLRLLPVLCSIDGLALVAFAFATRLATAAVLFGLFGALMGILEVRVVSLLQLRLPEEGRGRALGWLGPLFGPLSVVSLAVGSVLADAVGVVAVLAVSGVLEVAVAAGALLWLAGRPGLAALAEGGAGGEVSA